MDRILIGQRIRSARKEKKYTQEKLAEKMNVSVGYINQVETGKKCFNLPRFIQVSKVLDKTLSYFIEGVQNEKSASIKEIEDILLTFNESKLKIVKKFVLSLMED